MAKTAPYGQEKVLMTLVQGGAGKTGRQVVQRLTGRDLPGADRLTLGRGYRKVMRLLNIESSPRGSRSASIAVTSAFLEAYRQACPWVMVDTLNVWEEMLPDFDQEAIGAKYKGVSKEPMDQAETAVWDKIQELAVRFQQADRIVLGVPMWNFAYPYKLKQLIDLVCQRNMLFTYDGIEYGPLLKTPRAFVVYARGGTYAEDSPTPASLFDHQKRYIDFWLKFIGVEEVHTLVVEGTTWGGKEKGKEKIARGQEEAKKLAADF
ncbi:MAG TPA: NAD(P)H-dependent oxidoreductase [Streptosporangiaceae bacterium]|nr:NAD(P)H-dependent oxidoreductase [Streptosporangiaceae bacterium]